MVLQRNEINEKDTWDLSTIFETDQKWEEELALLTEDTKEAASLEGHLLGQRREPIKYYRALFGFEPSS